MNPISGSGHGQATTRENQVKLTVSVPPSMHGCCAAGRFAKAVNSPVSCCSVGAFCAAMKSNGPSLQPPFVPTTTPVKSVSLLGAMKMNFDRLEQALQAPTMEAGLH